MNNNQYGIYFLVTPRILNYLLTDNWDICVCVSVYKKKGSANMKTMEGNGWNKRM